jgi:hypothetical protein
MSDTQPLSPCCGAVMGTVSDTTDPIFISLKYIYCKGCKRLLDGNGNPLEPSIYHPLPRKIEDAFRNISSNEMAIKVEAALNNTCPEIIYWKGVTSCSYEFKNKEHLIFYKVEWLREHDKPISKRGEFKWEVKIYECAGTAEFTFRYSWLSEKIPTISDSLYYLQQYFSIPNSAK